MISCQLPDLEPLGTQVHLIRDKDLSDTKTNHRE